MNVLFGVLLFLLDYSYATEDRELLESAVACSHHIENDEDKQRNLQNPAYNENKGEAQGKDSGYKGLVGVMNEELVIPAARNDIDNHKDIHIGEDGDQLLLQRLRVRNRLHDDSLGHRAFLYGCTANGAELCVLCKWGAAF